MSSNMSLRGKLVKSKSLSDLALVNPPMDAASASMVTYRFDGDHGSSEPKSSWKLKLIDILDSIEANFVEGSTGVKKRIMPVLVQKNKPQLLFYSLAAILLSFYLYTHVHKHYHGKYFYANAYDQSYGLFRHINNLQWKTLKEYYHSSNPHKFGDVDTFIDDPNVWFQYNWNKNFICPGEERIGISLNNAGRGELGDGPKWVCNSRDIVRVVNDRMKPSSLERAKDTLGMNKNRANNGCLIYSIGVNAQHLGFEMGIQQMLTQEAENTLVGYQKGRPFCDIHVFDPDGYHEKLIIGDGVHYHNWGISSSEQEDSSSDEDDEGGQMFKSFQQTVKELNHEGHVIDIMKVDCKMCEWSIYKDWFDKGSESEDEDSMDDESSSYTGLAMIQQLLVEVHGTPEQEVNQFFERLRDENYVIFHKDANTEQFAGTSQDYAFLKLSDDFFKQ